MARLQILWPLATSAVEIRGRVIDVSAFLWGVATGAHQTEGNNLASDWWAIEHEPGSFVKEPSGDAVDSFHRWREDMDLAAGAGFTDYRFGVEWSRVEPVEGFFSRAQSTTTAAWSRVRAPADCGPL